MITGRMEKLLSFLYTQQFTSAASFAVVSSIFELTMLHDEKTTVAVGHLSREVRLRSLLL